jgi:hypothetical protein
MKVDGGGLRFNEGKKQWKLLPFDALGPIIDVMMYGANKYAPRNWERGMDWSISFDCLMRVFSPGTRRLQHPFPPGL